MQFVKVCLLYPFLYKFFRWTEMVSATYHFKGGNITDIPNNLCNFRADSFFVRFSIAKRMVFYFVNNTNKISL